MTFLATAKKASSGKWRIKVYDKELQRQVSHTGPTKKECEIWAAEYITRKRTPKSNRILSECVDEYISIKENILSPTTIDGYKRLNKNIISRIGWIRVSDITQTTLQQFVNELAAEYSPKYISNAYGLISSVLNVYRPEFRHTVTLPCKTKLFKQFPTFNEVYQAVKGTEIELPCLMALWLGMRMSEIRGAKKTDINGNVLQIRSVIVDVNNTPVEKAVTKTFESTRRLRLPPYILGLISALPAEQVYLTTLTGNTIYKRFMRALERNNLPRMSFHDLRHLNASAMLALGIPDKYAMERGGWSTPELMRNTYQHTFSAERNTVDDIVDSFFSETFFSEKK